MRYLSLGEVLELHRRIIEETGGSPRLRDLAALGFALIKNHPFVDGNKRVGHAALETFLVLNGFELQSDIDAAERVVMAVAAGDCGRDEFERWLRSSMQPLND